MDKFRFDVTYPDAESTDQGSQDKQLSQASESQALSQRNEPVQIADKILSIKNHVKSHTNVPTVGMVR